MPVHRLRAYQPARPVNLAKMARSAHNGAGGWLQTRIAKQVRATLGDAPEGWLCHARRRATRTPFHVLEASPARDSRTCTQSESTVIQAHQSSKPINGHPSQPAVIQADHSGHSSQSMVIQADQWSSEPTSGHQRPSMVIGGNWFQSEVVSGHQWPSVSSRTSARSSSDTHQRPSEAIRGHQRSSGIIRGHQSSHTSVRHS